MTKFFYSNCVACDCPCTAYILLTHDRGRLYKILNNCPSSDDVLVQKFLTVTEKNWGKNDWYGHDKSMYDNIK